MFLSLAHRCWHSKPRLNIVRKVERVKIVEQKSLRVNVSFISVFGIVSANVPLLPIGVG